MKLFKLIYEFKKICNNVKFKLISFFSKDFRIT